MTTGVRLTRMGKNRGRNLYAEYGAPFKPLTTAEAIKSGDTSEGGAIAFASIRAAGAVAGAFFGVNGALIIDYATEMLSIVPMVGPLIHALFGVKNRLKVFGREYTEFQLFQSKYGTPINEGDGNIRLAGNVIWSTDPKERFLRMEQKTSDSPDTFFEYKSRSGQTDQELLEQGTIIEGGIGALYYTYFERHYTLSLAVAFANIKSFSGQIVRIWADKEVIWDIRDSNLNEPVQLMYVGFRNSEFHTFYKDTVITVYDGKHTDRDPTIVADKGDDTPNYANVCYAVLKNIDLNDFNGRIPILEAEVSFRSSPIKLLEKLEYGPHGQGADRNNFGWTHDTTDGHLQGTVDVPYYYDVDIYDCIGYRSAKLYYRGVPYLPGPALPIHEIKYGFIALNSQFSTSVAYIDRRSGIARSFKTIPGGFNFPKQAIYNYYPTISGSVYSDRKVIFAHGLFGTALSQTWMFIKAFEDDGLILADGTLGGALATPVTAVGYNNQSGGLNTLGALGGLVFDRHGNYRITTDSGPFGTHGTPTYIWSAEYMGNYVNINSPFFKTQIQIPYTGAAGILTLLEDMGTLPGDDPEDNNGLLVMQVGGYLHHFNTTIDSNFFYTGITKTSTVPFTVQDSASFELPMSSRLPGVDIFTAGGLHRMINCAELEYTGTNWSIVTTIQNPNNDYVISGAAAQFPYWFNAVWMSATSSSENLSMLCKYRFTASNPTLAQVVTEIILSKVPYISAADLDVTSLTDIVRGYMMADTSKLDEFIERLRKGFFFDVVESSGKLKFIKRGISEDVIEIEESLLEDPIKVIVQSVYDLPKEAVLNYADVDFDYLQGAQRHRREQTTSFSLIETSLPISFNKDEAAKVAYIYITAAYAEYVEIQTTLDRRYSYLDCGDIISINQFNRIRIDSIVHLQDGGIQIQGVTENASAYNANIKGVSSIIGYESSILSGSKIKSFAFEVPYIEHQDNNLIGYVYFTAFKRFATTPISISISYDNSSFRYIGSSDPRKFIGRVVTMLDPPNYSIKHSTWDYTNYIDVYIQHGDIPVSCTEADVYLGANKVILGKEILNFTTVTHLGLNKFRLSGLLRGRDGTELYTRVHTTGEYLIELYDDMPRLQITEADIYKLALVHASNGYRTEVQDAVIIRGTSFLPLAPADIKAVYSGNNIVISWKRRNSAQGELIPYSDIPVGTVTSYSVDILNNNMTVKRTILSASTTATYTEAQQITDFGSVQTQISLIAYQHTPTLKGFGGYANINLGNRSYYTYFSGETLGVQPSDLTIVQGTYVTAVPVLYNNTKVLEINSGTTASENSIIKLNAMPLIADGDIRIKFSYDTFFGFEETYLFKIYIKGSKTYVGIKSNGTVTCYMEGLLANEQSIDSADYSITPLSKNVIYNIRIQYYEESIQIKIWDTVEPSDWQISHFPEVIGSQPAFLFDIAGYAGIGTHTRAAKLYIRDIEINDLY